MSNYDRVDKSADEETQYEHQWNHWAFTKNSSSGVMEVYINGQEWATESDNTRAFGDVNNFKIGSAYGGNLNYDGRIDDFRVYDHELSSTLIDFIYDSYSE